MKSITKVLSFTKSQRYLLTMFVMLYSSVHLYNIKRIQFKNVNVEQITLDSILHELNIEKVLKDSIIKNVRKRPLSKPSFVPRLKVSELTEFNPNIGDSLSLLQYGFSPFAVSNIIKYRLKGGEFKDCDDLLKIYGVDKEVYNKSKSFCKCDNPKKREIKLAIRIEINKADTSELMKIRGIGQVLSKRIIKYRDRLDGFYDINQLQEVYGIEQEVFQTFKKQLYINSKVRKMNLNSITYNDLIKHFYFDKHITNAIVNYVKQHGPLNSVEEIKKIKIIDEEIYSKIENYLSVSSEQES